MPQEVIIASGYIRLSEPHKQEKGYSKQFQEVKMRERCQAEGWLIKDDLIFYDGFKGTYRREREQLQELLKAARLHLFNILLLYDLDRLSRDPIHQTVILEELAYLGIRVVILDPQKKRIADGTFEGDVLTSLEGAISKEENRKRTRRTRDGVEQRVIYEHKLMPGHKALYGYHFDDAGYRQKNKFVIYEVEAVIVRRIFNWKAHGMPLREICHTLMQEGILSPSGKTDWHPFVIVRMITNPFYKGKAFALRYKHTFVPEKGMTRILRPQEEWIPLPDDVSPAIVSEEIWNEAQRQLQLGKARSPRNNKDPEASLCRGGIVVCGRCKSSYYFKNNYKREEKSGSYDCVSHVHIGGGCDNRTVSSQVIDNAVWEHCLEILQQPHLIEAGLNKLYGMENPNQKSIDGLSRLILKTGTKMQNLMEQLEDEHDVELQRMIRLRIADLNTEKKGYEVEMDTVKRHTLQWDSAYDAMVLFKHWCHGRYEKIQQGEIPTYQEKRNCVERLGIQVVVNRVPDSPGYTLSGYEITASPSEIVEHLGVQLYHSG